MANIMQMFRAKNKPSRDAYDLSKKLAFSCQVGELLPVYSRLCMSGDVFEISSKWKTRTSPINTAAFTRFREYYDWYFVPMSLLWDKFHIWTSNMVDNNQVATSIHGTTQLTDKHPYLTFDQIFTYLQRQKAAADTSSDFAFNQFGFARFKLQQKLLHLLGYGDYFDLETPLADNRIYNAEMNPWRLLAYQKIFQDWYRNSQWEVSSPQTCNINYINGSASDLQLPIADIRVEEDSMFDMRYANWNKDLFMGLLPNSQYGDAASIQLPAITANGGTFGLPFVVSTSGTESNIVNPSNSAELITADGRKVNVTANNSHLNSLRNSLNVDFTILALRQAEALQKLKEIQGSNSKDFPSQTDAIFGVRPSDAYSQRCKRLGGYDGTIEISDVDNTNITENEDGSFNGADIAGKALSFGSSNKPIKFQTDIPGVLMCIYHCVPLLDYALGNIAMDNLKTMYSDYANPVLDKTGMQQLPLIALTNKVSDFNPNVRIDFGSGLLGYAPLYIDYKTDVDEVKGAFYNGGLQAWVAPLTDAYIRQWISTTPSGAAQFRGLDYRFFKVDPRMLNPIFAVDSTDDISTDKIWINCYFDVRAVRPIDAQGLPY